MNASACWPVNPTGQGGALRDWRGRHDVVTDNQAFKDYVKPAPGYGLAALLGASRPQQAADLAPPPEAPAPPPVQGMVLERVEMTPPSPALPFAMLGLALLTLSTVGGAARALTNPALQRMEGAA